MSAPAALSPETDEPCTVLDDLARERRDVIGPLVKAIVVLRMLVVYPVVLMWLSTAVNPLEVAVLVVLGIESIIALVHWPRVAGFVEEHPLILGVDILLSIVVLASSGPGSPFFLFLSGTAVVIGLLYTGLARAMLTVSLLLSYLLVPMLDLSAATGNPIGSGGASPSDVVGLFGGLGLIACLVYLGHSLRRLQNRVNSAIERAGAHAREAALGEERSRIARELHDSTVKSLVGIELLARSIPKNPETAESTADLIATSAGTAIEESRRILLNLRTTALPPLEDSLRAIVDDLEETHPTRFSLDFEPGPELPVRLRYGARKVAEEAMANAALHSGSPEVAVRLTRGPGELRLSVSDSGTGFRMRRRDRAGHYGLTGMRERAAELGGSVDIDSAPRTGTRVTLSIPFDTTPEEHP